MHRACVSDGKAVWGGFVKSGQVCLCITIWLS